MSGDEFKAAVRALAGLPAGAITPDRDALVGGLGRYLAAAYPALSHEQILSAIVQAILQFGADAGAGAIPPDGACDHLFDIAARQADKMLGEQRRRSP